MHAKASVDDVRTMPLFKVRRWKEDTLQRCVWLPTNGDFGTVRGLKDRWLVPAIYGFGCLWLHPRTCC